MAESKSFAETYHRSTFFRLLGEAGKTLADAYTQADVENQTAIREMVVEAMTHSLVEHHGYTREEVFDRLSPSLTDEAR